MNLLAAFFFRTMVLGDVEDLDTGHVPNVTTTAGLSDFLIFACGIELQNCLCVSSYRPTQDPVLIEMLTHKNVLSPEEALWKYDVSSMAHETRVHNIASRARVRVTLRELFRHIVVIDGAGVVQEPWTFLYIPTLAWFIHALKGYYKRSFREDSLKAKEVPEIHVPDSSLFHRQLEWASRRWPELKNQVDYLEQQDIEADNLAYALPPFTILQCDVGQDDLETGTELFMLGMREAAPRLRRKLEEEDVDQAEVKSRKRQREK
ncbi:hypothetical protein H1R20_g5095, partial [Candolleomyces eurysporus]